MTRKNIISMKKNLFEYKAVIFDVDGTLYSQPKLRLFMAGDLFFYYLKKPLLIKELFILQKYRRTRENWTNSSSNMEEAQYLYVAKQMKTTPEQVKSIISHWIYDRPLSLLPKCQDKPLTDLMEQLSKHSIITAIYSDYPTEEKLKSMNIHTEYMFYSSLKDINCMKPEIKGMQAVLSKLGVHPCDALMIGDRYSKDGLAAKNMGMDFIVLSQSIPKRIKLYQTLKR